MTKIKVCLDPGHGAGARHNRGGVLFNEGDNNYKFSVYLKEKLEATGRYTVTMTRKRNEDDPSLAARGAMAIGHDIFLSIHTNAHSSAATSGTEVFDDINPRYANRGLAADLSRSIARALEIPDRGVKYRELSSGKVYRQPKQGASNWYGVIRHAYAKHNMLVEICFHTNYDDSQKFLDRYSEVADVFIDVLDRHYKIAPEVGNPNVWTKFVPAIKDAAIEGWRTHKILPSLTLAQAILESNWGRSELAQRANAIFGIKAHTDPGHTRKYEKSTWEWVNGKKVQVNDWFKAYESWEESLADRLAYLTSRKLSNGQLRYKDVIGETDYKKACRAIWKAGYATDPKYPDKLIDLIERHKLYKYDVLEEEGDMLDYAICYVNDGDVINALNFVNALGNRACLVKTRDGTDLPAKKVIQVGGPTVKGADRIVAGENRIDTLNAVNACIQEIHRGEY